MITTKEKENLYRLKNEDLLEMEGKRREIISGISDLPPSKKELVIKKVDELILLVNKCSTLKSLNEIYKK